MLHQAIAKMLLFCNTKSLFKRTMEAKNKIFNLNAAIHELKHYLPAQAPLKDFVHHNTLHAFQNQKFFDAIRNASGKLGYKTSLSLNEFRTYYKNGKINKNVFERIVNRENKNSNVSDWYYRLVEKKYDTTIKAKIGSLRDKWKTLHYINLDAFVQPVLFRIVGSYLDQGISIWNFPVLHQDFITSLRELEKNSFVRIFKTERPRQLLLKNEYNLENLLSIVVGDESLYEQYMFDQQFSHQGWSGMVSAIEDQPQGLLDSKKISLHDLIIFELLLEIDALDYKFGRKWLPLANGLNEKPLDLFCDVEKTELDEVIKLWQEIFEWSYYDEVLNGILQQKSKSESGDKKSFEALFCIDDRECSVRRYIEEIDPKCKTYGTPGFFGVEFFYQPTEGKFYTKLCPAPVTPKYLIKEEDAKSKRRKDLHLTKHSHSLFSGWLITQTLGLLSALRLFFNIFKPSGTPATTSSFKHMERTSKLSIESSNPPQVENGLQIGFTVSEMADRVEGVLRSIGLTNNFASIVYVIGHGASSVNNPHYSAYDCGACCGRPGSVNARVFSFMANHKAVRNILAERNISIPEETQFIGALHDTTRDDIEFYDEDCLNKENLIKHVDNIKNFEAALNNNAKERSRRLELVNTKLRPEQIHRKLQIRSVSLFEPRPELNHATNALCIVGRRDLTSGLFLDRRSFMNSYDYTKDADGKYLFNILKAAAPVCGGINLEYYFSRVDNQKLGAGTKLPHNVMGLIGVANGIDGDLRPGLPSQMIEVHDPVRLLIIVEHYPDVVYNTITKNPETYEWFKNEWVHLVVVNPQSKTLHRLVNEKFELYKPTTLQIQKVSDLNKLFENSSENLPVTLIN